MGHLIELEISTNKKYNFKKIKFKFVTYDLLMQNGN